MDGLTHDDGEYGALEDSLEDDPDENAVAAQLEERVLAAFLNDPVLARKQVEISAEGDGVVSLAGSVENESDSQHAALIAGGIPGVLGVSNGIRIRAARRRQAQ
jgi:osmotically-inducible protein OsmY